ncbi:MAG: hypothetical protein KKG47_06080 [Proteobacteria bacterium]|nr:hypothetical protein [Pseudomonadota bacterium]MBU1737042.1 hypothetical protein [Pseudomonadota bacterium]
MKKSGRRNIILFLALLLLPVVGCNQELQRISGKVALIGHEPFTHISIKDENRVEYKIVGPLAGKLAGEFQGKTLTLEGTISRKAIGPGFPAEFTAIRIID